MAYFKLKGFFAEKGIKHKDVAKLLNIAESNFSRKINKNGEDFTKNQVIIICKKYNLDANIYFLQ
ncbi:hypothetical protein [Helcococcus kunzii]|uniref:hypothetical protein n=1 Tax=Helcococcus kunzii TaxID=40091 RepID=UPI0024ADCC9D|nr:hypothetical protein [Helcococcus kunzii]